MLHCTFGEKQAGASYRTRLGAYLIAVSGAQIASIRTPKGFFLPGGGVEPGETHEACILRECLEETGFLVQVGELLGSAESYLMHEKIGAFHPVQHYYAGAFLEFVCAPVELDHTLVWLPCEKAAEQMNVEQQAWAVRKALEKLAWMKEHIE